MDPSFLCPIRHLAPVCPCVSPFEHPIHSWLQEYQSWWQVSDCRRGWRHARGVRSSASRFLNQSGLLKWIVFLSCPTVSVEGMVSGKAFDIGVAVNKTEQSQVIVSHGVAKHQLKRKMEGRQWEIERKQWRKEEVRRWMERKMERKKVRKERKEAKGRGVIANAMKAFSQKAKYGGLW